MAEVDAFRQEIRDTFLGVKHPPLTLGEVRDKRFTMARRGYNVQQVDAFVDEAEQRLAGMQPPDRSVDPDGSATDAASTPTDGDIEGWTPPPWSSDAADTRPFWRTDRRTAFHCLTGLLRHPETGSALQRT